MKECDCIKQVNERLGQMNAVLSTGMQIIQKGKVREVTLMAVEKLDKSKRTQLPMIGISYCPFCGAPIKQKDLEEK